MKRDYDLVKAILARFENAEPMKSPRILQFEGYPDDVVKEHLILLIEAEYIHGKVSNKGMVKVIVAERLTWAGHDALAAMKDDGIWDKAKKTILNSLLKNSPRH